MDISASKVFTDPAPVDTLVQRAGRCARWFEKDKTIGTFTILKSTKEMMHQFAGPYDEKAVDTAIKACKTEEMLSWNVERAWIDSAWGSDPKKAAEVAQQALDASDFALNLFDRAAQERSPGQIANTFREILSIEVGVMINPEVVSNHLTAGRIPLTSSISLANAQRLWNQHRTDARILRDYEGQLQIGERISSIELGDILFLSESVAHVHRQKGLCLKGCDDSDINEVIPDSELWIPRPKKLQIQIGDGGKPQSLIEHTKGVMNRTRKRLCDEDKLGYRKALLDIIGILEPSSDSIQLADAIATLSELAAGLHDIGKGNVLWQEKARLLAKEFTTSDLIGRTGTYDRSIRFPPHTPPSFSAIVKAAELLMGDLGTFGPLVRAIALAAARHHSAFLNPARQISYYEFQPDARLLKFVQEILQKCGGDIQHAENIIEAATQLAASNEVPLMLPNDDLFPIYALVGRAILMSDREDAAGKDLETRVHE